MGFPYEQEGCFWGRVSTYRKIIPVIQGKRAGLGWVGFG